MADVTPGPADGDVPAKPTEAADRSAAASTSAEKKPPARKSAAKKPAQKPAATAAAAKKPASRARPASSAAKPAAASASTPVEPDAPAAVDSPATTAPAPAAVEPAPAPAQAPTAVGATSGSFLDKVRANRMGTLTAALAVALATALLLSVLVPNEPGLLAMVILSAAIAAAVGFTVRYLSHCRGLRQQVIALIATVIGVHVMSVTGTVGGEIPVVGDLIGAGVPFDDALLAALATPALSTGAFLSGLVAAIIAGWGERVSRAEHRSHHA